MPLYVLQALSLPAGTFIDYSARRSADRIITGVSRGGSKIGWNWQTWVCVVVRKQHHSCPLTICERLSSRQECLHVWYRDRQRCPTEGNLEIACMMSTDRTGGSLSDDNVRSRLEQYQFGQMAGQKIWRCVDDEWWRGCVLSQVWFEARAACTAT